MKQHFVPQCYLKAWCDPTTPSEQEPYIWLFSKNGETSKKKAPKKILYETDMYTIKMPDGSSDYRLENGLHDLEDVFISIRENKLKNKLPLTITEHILLLTFISALHNRTKVQRDHYKKQWGQVRDLMDNMIKSLETTTPEQRKMMEFIPAIPREKDRTLTYDDVCKLEAGPMQQMLFAQITAEVPLLARIDIAIFTTNSSPGFITSDRPCVWFDPKAYLRPPLYRAPALIYPSIEITIPISPNQAILLNRSGLNGYFDAGPKIEDEYNRRTRFYTDEYFIVNSDVKKEIWFNPGIEPSDSWEKMQEKLKEKGD